MFWTGDAYQRRAGQISTLPWSWCDPAWPLKAWWIIPGPIVGPAGATVSRKH